MSEQASHFRGVAHVHSSHSYDATCSYAELRRLFVDAGLHFACMTEHIEHLVQADIDAIIRDCREHSDNNFLFVPGIEMDCFVVYFLGLKGAAFDFTSNETLYRDFRQNSEICALSHPIKAHFQYPDWIRRDCDAVELLNAKHDGKFFFRYGSEALLRSIRRSRPTVVGLAGIDFHDQSQLCSIHMRLTNSGPLTTDFVTGELKAGNFRVWNGDRCMADEGLASRAFLRARIGIMDVSHAVHRGLRRSGVRVPKPIRRLLSRHLEGG